MGEFKKRGDFGGERSGGGRSFGGRPSHGGGFSGGSSGGSFGGRSRFGRPGNKEFRQAQMFSATCSACNKPCEVPFRPNGEKPVYCNYCFGKNKSGGSSDAPRRDFTPSTSTAPVARPAIDGGQIAEMKKQLEVMSAKIDKIMEMVSKKEEVKVVEAPVKKVAAKKAVTKVAKKK